MNVSHILSQKGSAMVETIGSSMPVSEAAGILSSKRIGALIVSDDGTSVAGIVSERDIIRVLGAEGVACLDRPVSSLMTAEVSACAKTDPAVDVLKAMTNGRFRHMPVLEEGALIGVISIGDVVKARISEIEMENAALEDMIKGV